MNYFRDQTVYIQKKARQYPIIALLGPRQSGKTTLCKQVFTKMKYVSLEDPDTAFSAEKEFRYYPRQDRSN